MRYLSFFGRFGVVIGIVVLCCQFAYTQSNDVRLWGASITGPGNGNGFIFSANPDGTDFINHKSFGANPDGGLPVTKMIKGTDGFFYGTTTTGGTENSGVIYKINGDGTGYTRIFEFNPETGNSPSELIEGSDGRLYGMLGGTKLFAISKDGQGFVVLKDFYDPPSPVGYFFRYAVTQGSDGFLYGASTIKGAHDRGTIFRIKTDGSNLQKIHDLTPDESYEPHPFEGHDGLLYWMGGSPNNRILYRIDKAGNNRQVLHEFGPAYTAYDIIQLPDHTLLGVVSQPSSSFFKIQPDGTGYQELYSMVHDGSPISLTLASNGKIYGTGENNNTGFIYRIDINGSNFTKIQSNVPFASGKDYRGVVETTPGNFLGVAAAGAVSDNGGIFTINDAGNYTLRKEFSVPDGIRPIVKLLLASDGNLYGTTVMGGLHGAGTIFRIAKDGSGYARIYDFETPFYDISNFFPTNLVESAGFLFGVRREGIFRIAFNGSGFIMVHNNSFPNNSYHFGNMLVGQDGAIYGMKSYGNNFAGGYVFKVNLNGSGYTEILDTSVTTATTGTYPVGISQLANGDLVVITAFNGPSNYGTIFTMKTDGSGIVVVRPNDSSHVPQANGSIALEGSDGMLYATTFSSESMLSMEKNGSNFASYPLEIQSPGGTLVEITGKRLYGVGGGGLVRFDMQSKQVSKLPLPQYVFSLTGLTPVTKQSQTVTMDPIANKTFGQGPFVVSATSSLARPVTYTSSNTSVATISGDVVTIVGAGTATIKAYQAGSVTIGDASDSKTFTVSKANTAVAIASIGFGKQGEVIQLQANPGVHDGPISYSVNTNAATVDGDKLTLISPGVVDLKLTVGESDKYLQAEAHLLFTITLPAPQASFTSPSSGNAGTSFPVGVNKGGSNGSVTLQLENLSGSASLNGNTLSLTSPGKVKLTATISSDVSHSATTIVQVITINTSSGAPFKAPPTLVGGAGAGAKESGILFQIPADFSKYAILNHFKSDPGGSAQFQCQLLNTGDGDLYGTVNGGEKSGGAIFKYSTTGFEYSIEYNFAEVTGWNPAGFLTLASDGMIYGLTGLGGVHDNGVVYQYNRATKVYTKKADLKLDETGGFPRGGFVEGSPGRLFAVIEYGTANSGGTIVEYNIATSTLTKRHDFLPGTNPNPYLTLAPNGKLYGMSGLGGNNGEGTLFEFDPATNATTIKVHLDRNTSGTVPLGGLALAANGKLYGHPNGGDVEAGIMEYVPGATTANAVFQLTDVTGYMPFGNMISANDGMLYGMASFGAANNFGSIFKFDPNTHDYTVKYSFHRVTGGQPYGALVSGQDGKFYGMTGFGGAHESGVFFVFDPATNNYTILKNFLRSENGSTPYGKLLIENDKIYGAAGGGTTGLGLIYEYNQSTGIYTKKKELNAQTGIALKTLIRHPNGKVYTVSETGHPSGPGKILEVDLVTGTTIALASLPAYERVTSIALASNGKLYGTASGNSDGSIFEFDPATNTYTTKFDLNNATTGYLPTQISEGSDGILYGVTRLGGPNGGGVLFSYDYNMDLYTSHYHFDNVAGAYNPHGKLALVDGTLYGLLLYGGQFGKGAVFSHHIATHTTTILKQLEKPTTEAGLIVGLNNKLIGTFAKQGTGTHGSIFEYHPGNGILETKFTFDGVNGSRPTELVMIKGDQAITFGPIAPLTAASGPFALTATTNSGLQITYVSSNPDIAYVNGNVLMPLASGEVRITASQAGDAAYNAAAPVEVTVQIIKANQSIVFEDGAATLDMSPFTLQGHSTSTLPLTYTTTSDKLTISGNQATLLKAGKATIKATQAGDGVYNAATPVERNFCVVPNKPVISGSLSGSPPYTLTSSNDAGNQWYYNGKEMVGSTAKTLTVLTAGSYTVITTVEGCFSEPSAPAIVLVTGLHEISSQRINVYPNPAEHEINIELRDEGHREISIAMIDGVGRVIEQRQSHTNTQERFVTNGLPKGIFYFRINTAGSFLSYKFEKQ